MNRNMMYDLLEDVGLKGLRHFTDKKKYYVRFTLDQSDPNQVYCEVITDWGYIRDVESFNLCTDEVVIQGKYSDMKINIKYKSIEKFDVRVFDAE